MGILSVGNKRKTCTTWNIKRACVVAVVVASAQKMVAVVVIVVVVMEVRGAYSTTHG